MAKRRLSLMSLGLICMQAMAWCTFLATGGGCDADTLLNQTALFGPSGSSALAGAPINSGQRGVIQVVFENNTPFRALFTYGMFDNTDERSIPFFRQFSPDSQLISPVGGSPTLEGNTISNVIAMPCARVFSIGSRSLISLIAKNARPLSDSIDDSALLDGIGFADAAITFDEASLPTEGFAPGFEAWLGVDFNCGSLLRVQFEFDDVGNDRFRTLIQVFPVRGDE